MNHAAVKIREELRKLSLIFCILIMLLLKLVWFSAFRTAGSDVLSGADRNDLMARRRYLIAQVQTPALSQGSILPYAAGEWELATLSMTTAALTNMAFDYPETREESLRVIGLIIDRALSDQVKDFDARAWAEDPIDSLGGQNGHIGYLGHLNFMIGAFRLLGGGSQYDSLHQQITSAFVRRIQSRAFPYLETYPQTLIFSADNTVVIASICLFDAVAGTDHQELIRGWLGYTKRNLLDSETGLVVFFVDPRGNKAGVSRGSANGWNSFYLPFIDRQFAKEQYLGMKRHLVDALSFGLLGLREYRRGTAGSADIDSGPIVFGLSTSGTGFLAAGAKHEQDAQLLDGLLRTAEAAGFSFDWKNTRRYLLAPLVGDAVMLAMRTANDWDRRFLEERR